ncbi:Neutrophil cytosol factor 2 [Collichthys lucidus]|uniref:Neutrophil cytosol factor 2 n=1 Tax=Collichthys lucidus TaxID=240159 RepID=A0A4U5VJD7_COLLU|nr:Neutrophil cytosol factor 2 [Collichthys lucidus]
MSFLDTLRQWDTAVTFVDRQDLSEALKIFLSIQEPNSKIYFDIGCLHLLNQDLDAAEKAFDCSIRKDEHLAVAFFQRGITFYKKQRYEESLADFQQAFKALRGNQLIDYKALGLIYKLYACEVLYNMALAQAQLGNWEKAQENLVKALDYKTDAKLNIIDKALQSTLKQKLFKPVEFPSKVLFKPNKNYVAELEKKDYLGKATVEDSPACPKEPEVLRALEGEPHTVLFEFVPETSSELAVVPGNIVFVLKKDADNWASVIFNERRGLVPYNYLERLALASKQNGWHSLHGINIGRENLSLLLENHQPGLKGNQATDNSFIVKVRFTFNFAVSVPPGSSYALLIEKISKKINLPTTAIIMSLTSEATGQSAINADTEMQSVWSSASGRRLTLWCIAKEQTDGKPQNEIHLVALHSYESSNPEDLNFHEGDKITLLSRVNQDWFEGQHNGNTGIFPASFVEEVPDSDLNK